MGLLSDLDGESGLHLAAILGGGGNHNSALLESGDNAVFVNGGNLLGGGLPLQILVLRKFGHDADDEGLSLPYLHLLFALDDYPLHLSAGDSHLAGGSLAAGGICPGFLPGVSYSITGAFPRTSSAGAEALLR